jgi:hypothetical protein
MVSKTTKSIASRIPVDLYFKLQNEADLLELNMKDYLLKIIKERNEKKSKAIPKEKSSPQKEKENIAQKQKIKKKTTLDSPGTSEIIFPL